MFRFQKRNSILVVLALGFLCLSVQAYGTLNVDKSQIMFGSSDQPPPTEFVNGGGIDGSFQVTADRTQTVPAVQSDEPMYPTTRCQGYDLSNTREAYTNVAQITATQEERFVPATADDLVVSIMDMGFATARNVKVNRNYSPSPSEVLSASEFWQPNIGEIKVFACDPTEGEAISAWSLYPGPFAESSVGVSYPDGGERIVLNGDARPEVGGYTINLHGGPAPVHFI